MKLVREEPETGARYWALHIENLSEWPADLTHSGDHFRLLIACDARSLSDDALLAFAKTVAHQGIVYLDAWGPDCERMHDRFDDALNATGHNDVGVVMTTWHHAETLDEALWDFLIAAYPHDVYPDCQSWIALSVGKEEWNQQIEERLSNRQWPSEYVSDNP